MGWGCLLVLYCILGCIIALIDTNVAARAVTLLKTWPLWAIKAVKFCHIFV